MISLLFDKISKINVTEKEFDFHLSDLDFYIMNDSDLYCYGCALDVRGKCNIHDIKWILNRSIKCSYNDINSLSEFTNYFSIESPIANCNCEGNAIKHLKFTLPNNLIFKPSKICSDEIGVWSLEFISKGTIFGPFLGVTFEIKSTHENVYEKSINGHAWLIWRSDNRKSTSIVDAENCFSSNWMRCINCCHDIKQQNLIAIQYYGHIFYRVCEDIPPHTELIVSYEIQHEKDVEIAKNEILTKNNFDSPFYENVPQINSDLAEFVENQIIDASLSKQLFETESPRIDKSLNKSCLINKNEEIDCNQCHSHSIIPCINLKCDLSDRSVNQTIPINIVKNIYNPSNVNHGASPCGSNNFNSQMNTNFEQIFNGSNFFSFQDYLPQQISQYYDEYNECLDNCFYYTQFPIMAYYNDYFTTQNNNTAECSIAEETEDFPMNNYPMKFSFENHIMDKETIDFIRTLCFSEPYICIERITDIIFENFPGKKNVKNQSTIDWLKLNNSFYRNLKIIHHDEETISSIVKLYQSNGDLSVEQIHQKFVNSFPNKPPIDFRTINKIIESNFPIIKLKNTDKNLTSFIEKLMKNNANLTVSEMYSKIRDKFPSKKSVCSMEISKIMRRTRIQTLKTKPDKIDTEVKKIVQKICQDFKKEFVR